MWRRGKARASGRVSEELAAYLGGHYVEYLRDQDRPVPTWAWLNLLAHGTEAEIAAERALVGAHVEATRWRDARSYLAGEVLAILDADPVGLANVQESVLVPVELRFIEGGTTPGPSLADLVATVLAGLEAYRQVLKRR